MKIIERIGFNDLQDLTSEMNINKGGYSSVNIVPSRESTKRKYRIL